jgi:hypothetical protein
MTLNIINRLNKQIENPEQGRNDDINNDNVDLPYKIPKPDESINIENGIKDLKKNVYLQK